MVSETFGAGGDFLFWRCRSFTSPSSPSNTTTWKEVVLSSRIRRRLHSFVMDCRKVFLCRKPNETGILFLGEYSQIKKACIVFLLVQWGGAVTIARDHKRVHAHTRDMACYFTHPLHTTPMSFSFQIGFRCHDSLSNFLQQHGMRIDHTPSIPSDTTH
jgi:hypothetical protein